MDIRPFLVSVLFLIPGTAQAYAQISDPLGGARSRPDAGSAPSPRASLPVYGNPCAPYAWCGLRDAWGNPVRAAPVFGHFPDTSGEGAEAGEILEPRVNGWTGAVEYRRPDPYAGLIVY